MNISNTQVPYSQPSVETMVGNTKQEYPKPSVPPEIANGTEPNKQIESEAVIQQSKIDDKPNGTGLPRDLDVASKNITNPDTFKIATDVKESDKKAIEQNMINEDRQTAQKELKDLQTTITKQKGYETYAQNMGMLM